MEVLSSGTYQYAQYIFLYEYGNPSNIIYILQTKMNVLKTTYSW